FLNTSFISFIYCLKGTGVSLESFFFLIKNITIKTEIRQNKGIEKKGKNQITAVKAAPKIGLNTLPAVFAVSIIPSVALATDSLEIDRLLTEVQSAWLLKHQFLVKFFLTKSYCKLGPFSKKPARRLTPQYLSKLRLE